MITSLLAIVFIVVVVVVLAGYLVLVIQDVSRLKHEVDRLYDAVAGLTAAQMAADRELTGLRADLASVRAHVARRGLDDLDDPDDRSPSPLY